MGYLKNQDDFYDCSLVFMRSLDDGRKRWWAIDFDENSESMSDSLDIYLAKQFWRFCEFVRNEDLEMRREVLARFANHENKYIGLVAMIESLPVSIWRRILWRYNINFESFDLFFKRLSEGEEYSIFKNYKEFMRGDTPSVLTIFEKMKEKFQMVNLVVEPEDSVTRRESKGSWTYNLLNLGLGFNAYEDDSEVKNNSTKSWRDFVKTDNHIDDFVVNQEFGRYFWLYRTARSNYGWKRNTNVKLNSHICPGWWWTFIIHIHFWFLSPVGGIGSSVAFQSSYKLLGYITLPLALITPLWCLSAIIWTMLRMALPESRRRKIFDFTSDFIDKVVNKIKNKVVKNKILGSIAYYIGCAIVSVFSLVITCGFTCGMFWLCFSWLDDIIGIYLSAPLFILLTPYIIHQFWCIFTKQGVIDHDDVHRIINYYYLLIIPVSVISIGVVIYPSIIDAILFLFGIGSIFYLSLLAVLVPISVFLAFSKMSDEMLQKFCDLFTVISFIALSLGIFGFYQVIMSASIDLDIWGAIAALIPIAVFMVLSLRCAYLLALYQPSIEKRFREDDQYSQLYIVYHIPKWQLKWCIRKNKFLKGLSPERQLEIIDKTEKAAYHLFSWGFGSQCQKAFLLMLPIVNEKSLDELIEKAKDAESDFIDDEILYFAIEGIFLKGLSFEEAILYGREKLDEVWNKRNKREKIIGTIFFPLIWLWSMISQLRWINDYFEKMCPSVKTNNVLDFK